MSNFSVLNGNVINGGLAGSIVLGGIISESFTLSTPQFEDVLISELFSNSESTVGTFADVDEALSSSYSIIDLIYPTYKIAVSEDFILLVNQEDNIVYANTIIDFLYNYDSVLILISSSISDSILTSDNISTIVDVIVKISNSIIYSDSTSTKLIYLNSLVETFNVLDSAIKFFTGTIADNISLLSSINEICICINTLLNSLDISTAVSPSTLLFYTTTDIISLLENTASSLISIEDISNNFIISIPTAAGQDTYLGYLFSPETTSITNYTNYNFDGATVFGGRYLFFNSTGLYEYGGDTDNSTDIISSIQTAAMNFGSSNLKQVPYLYLGISSSNYIILKVRIDGKAEVFYKLNKKTDNLETLEIKLGKGLIGRYFQFEIISDSANFDLESIDFLPIELKRKL